MNLKEMREKRLALAKKLVELGGKESPTDAELSELKTVREEFNALGEQIKLKEDLDAASAHVSHMSQSAGRASGVVTQQMQTELDNGRQGARAVDFRPLGQRVVESEQFTTFREERRGNTGEIAVGRFYRGPFHGEQFEAGGGASEAYTLIQTSALPSAPPMIAPFRRSEVAMPDFPEFNVRMAFTNLGTTSNSIEFWRELLFTNAAAFTAEGVAAPESALTFEASSVPVKRLPHYIPVTQIALNDEPRLRGLIEGRLIEGLRAVEDDALITGSGAGENIRGLLNVSGVQALDAAYWGNNPVENVGALNEDYDRLTVAKQLIRTVGRGRANVVLLSPEDMTRLISITDANNNYYAGNPFNDIVVTRFRGMLVIETETLTAGTAIVADGRMFEIYDREDAAVTAGWINDDFIKGKLALLAEERLAFAPIRPQTAAVVTLA